MSSKVQGKIKDGRQWSETIDGIRDDHVQRYRVAGKIIRKHWIIDNPPVADLGCGCGYGSFILASEYGLKVTAVEIDEKAVEFAKKNYSHDLVAHQVGDVMQFDPRPNYAIVLFEVLEHLEHTEDFFNSLYGKIGYVIGSVPNESEVPYDSKTHKYHFRHYTPDQITSQIEGAGFKVRWIGGQVGKHGEAAKVIPNVVGVRTIFFVATP